jgi:hypothetical protein
MRSFLTIVLFGLAALGSVAQEASRQTNRTATAFPEWEKLIGPSAEVTCKPAYYRRLNDGFLVPADEARSTDDLRVDGIVLSIIEPDRFKGQVLAFHFDFPVKWDHWYKPGVLYTGVIRVGYIGKLAFMCDPGWHAAATNGVSAAPNPQGGANGGQPLGSGTNRTSAAAAPRRSP